MFSVIWRYEHLLHSLDCDENFVRGNDICKNALLNLKGVFIYYYFQGMCQFKGSLPEHFSDSQLLPAGIVNPECRFIIDTEDIHDAHRGPQVLVTVHISRDGLLPLAFRQNVGVKLPIYIDENALHHPCHGSCSCSLTLSCCKEC